MKFKLCALLFLLSLKLIAQQKLPVINAQSRSARIYEEGNSVKGWGIDPKVALDTYTTSKISGKKTVKFKTDIDSISVKLKQGEKFDFIVLLDRKDSCRTRLQGREAKNYSTLKPEIPDSIPFNVNKFNTNLVNVVLNNIDTLSMNFDTGATEFSLLEKVLETKVKSKPKLYNSLNEIKLGHRSYYSKIYDTQNVGDQADGLMGWDLFDGYVIELNYDKNLMVIHSKLPKAVSLNRSFSKFKINYINDKPFIESKISQNGVINKNWFLFDLGYQRTVMLDRELLQNNNFPADKMEVIKKVMLHGTRNNEIPVITANLEKLELGPFLLKNLPAQLLGENKPMRGINIHILGNEILKRFNTFLDFQKDVIYLMPNQSFNLNYADQKKY
ncbi:hypothetical protein [Pedobacter agri]|uniref:Aspartyl protease n=1 Tax=Pedobacter agri TaxID=454586 RepID=A0A9X3I8I2_9SPHI|nr:hypothetical protein [Pedobacter agri]MCX3264852.1 hypothetical protein [Pedobacter agri]